MSAKKGKGLSGRSQTDHWYKSNVDERRDETYLELELPQHLHVKPLYVPVNVSPEVVKQVFQYASHQSHAQRTTSSLCVHCSASCGSASAPDTKTNINTLPLFLFLFLCLFAIAILLSLLSCL